jgi:hypothetical protein
LRTPFITSAEDPANRGGEAEIYNRALLAVVVEVPGVPEPLFSA